MAQAEVRFRSEALGRWATYQVLLPDEGEGPFPVVLQLHGLSDDSRCWIERSNIQRYAEETGLIVAFPDGETSGYLNWLESGRLHRNAYEDLIVKDIPENLRRNFKVTDGPWGIGGLSMGGYGSMRIGLKHPDLFASIWSHSSAFVINEHLAPNLMDPAALADADCRIHAQNLLKNTANQPVITFDCGVDDELIQSNRDFHAYLDKIGLKHTYTEHPGAHTWEYWDLHVQSALKQHARVLTGK